VAVLPYDLSKPDGIPALVQSAWEAFGGLTTVYLNAGISQRTSVEDTSMDMLRLLMEIDYFAPAGIAKELLPRMVAQGGGHIGVTTSIAGRFGFRLRCGYCSAKAALYGFFETLQAESYDQGIRVTIVCPGRVRTNISLRALDKGGKPHGKMDPGQAGGITVEKAAQKIVKAIRIARKCIRIVNENIWFAIGVKFLCLILGALGIANMWLAIFADVGVMVLCVLNAVRALFVKNV
jgi:NAD(P)-dependent dehydrogenase (short-subunit alcohol dehydrogenase family)